MDTNTVRFVGNGPSGEFDFTTSEEFMSQTTKDDWNVRPASRTDINYDFMTVVGRNQLVQNRADVQHLVWLINSWDDDKKRKLIHCNNLVRMQQMFGSPRYYGSRGRGYQPSKCASG